MFSEKGVFQQLEVSTACNAGEMAKNIPVCGGPPVQITEQLSKLVRHLCWRQVVMRGTKGSLAGSKASPNQQIAVFITHCVDQVPVETAKQAVGSPVH